MRHSAEFSAVHHLKENKKSRDTFEVFQNKTFKPEHSLIVFSQNCRLFPLSRAHLRPHLCLNSDQSCITHHHLEDTCWCKILPEKHFSLRLLHADKQVWETNVFADERQKCYNTQYEFFVLRCSGSNHVLQPEVTLRLVSGTVLMRPFRKCTL